MEPKIDSKSTTGSRPAPLRHPTPDLQSLQGAYIKNIAKLERSAEEMSASGSDLGEEIRRLSRQNSVQSSNNGEISVVRSSVMERMGSTRSNRSGSYGANPNARWTGYSPTGFVTSPVGSTSGSWSHASLSRVQSGSRSSRLAQVSEPLQEGKPLDSPLRSTFSVHEEDTEHSHQSAMALPTEQSRDVSQSSFAQRYDDIAGQIQSSLAHIPPSPTNGGAHVHRQQALHHLEVGGDDTPPERPRSTDTYREAQVAFKDFDGVHFSPDTDEFVEIDESGHEVRRVSARSTSGGLSNAAASMLRTANDRPISQAPPPPDEGMVYYPAPVPRMLNLPKRLSQLPAANVQAKRRSQVIGTLPPDVRSGAPWLAEETLSEGGGVSTNRHRSSGSGSSGALPRGGFLNERMSDNVNNLPPQLRANMFFEHQPVQHDVEVKSESAVATLDSILAASATAPVHAFTDHPYAGDVRKSVYSQERSARKSTATLASAPSPEQKKVKKRRSSSIGALLRRATSSDEVTNTLQKRNSRASMLTDFNEGGNKLRKRQSQLSLGTQLDKEGPRVQTPALEITEPEMQSGLITSAQNASPHGPDDDRRVSRAPTVMSSGYKLDDADQDEDEYQEEDEEEDDIDGDSLYVQPSTLLAELQVRKAQMKSRTKTAATAFPKGMHSTLLQLDAVEEISKRKRQQQRIALAWEDPHQRALQKDLDQNDEDVPLGMLFPGREGQNARKVGDGKDFDRPLGLMEKREMEDSEPLSRRRNRLRGGSPTRERAPNASQLNLVAEDGNEGTKVDGDAAAEGEEEETLGQRIRRMKTKAELDGAIAEVVGDGKEGERPASGLVDDVMSQFGGLDVKDKEGSAEAGASPQMPAPDEEETLGQRRARLQREREASGDQRNVSGSSADRPPLETQSSFANLLSNNPVGQRMASKVHEPAQGSLLHTNAQQQAKHRDQLQSTNLNSANHDLHKPLVDSRQQKAHEPNSGGLLAQPHNSRAPVGGYAAGAFNNGTGGINTQQQSTTSPMMGMGTANGMSGYFASPTAAMAGYNGYGYGTPGGMMGYPYTPQQTQMPMQQPMMMGAYQQTNPLAYNALNGGYPGAQGINGFMGNAYMPQTMGGGTYASFAQNQSFAGAGGAYASFAQNQSFAGAGSAGMGMGIGMAGPDENQRAAIDRWRLSVAQQ